MQKLGQKVELYLRKLTELPEYERIRVAVIIVLFNELNRLIHIHLYNLFHVARHHALELIKPLFLIKCLIQFIKF